MVVRPVAVLVQLLVWLVMLGIAFTVMLEPYAHDWADAAGQVSAAMFTLGQLPIGPSIGAAAAVLILGADGVAATAAAGVLLTVTSTVGSRCYAAWAVGDRMLAGRLGSGGDVVAPPVAVAPASA